MDGCWSAGKMPFESYRIHEVPDDVLAALDYCYEQGWTDGLPVVPPVIDRVEATLAYEVMCRARCSSAWGRYIIALWAHAG